MFVFFLCNDVLITRNFLKRGKVGMWIVQGMSVMQINYVSN